MSEFLALAEETLKSCFHPCVKRNPILSCLLVKISSENLPRKNVLKPSKNASQELIRDPLK